VKRTFLSVIILLGLCGFLPAQYIQTVGEPADTLKQGHVQIDSTLKFRGNDLTSFLQLVDANGQVLDAGIKSAATWNTAYSHSTSSHPYGNVGTKSVNESSIANGKVLKYNSASGNVEYADDDGTTYTASGLGIKLSGNQFSLSLDGSTLSQGASGVKVTDNTFAAYGHAHSGTYEPAITTLSIAKGGTNATSYTANQLLRMNSAGTAFESAGVTTSSFATSSHVHTGTYEPAITTLGIAKGGTNATSYTAGHLLRMNVGGTAFESAGVTVSSFATSGHAHSGTYEPANANIQSHITNTSNPHSVTATQVLPSQTGNSGKVLGTNGTTASWVAASSGTGDIEGVNVTGPITGGGSSGTVTIGADTSTAATALATKGWVQRQGYGIGGGDITSVVAGDGLKGGAVASDATLDLNLSANGGLQTYSDSLRIKLEGTTLSRSSLGLKVTENTFAAYSHAHSGTYEPVITTLGIAKGGTNATSYTANQLLRMNSAGTAFESAGVTAASFATSSHDHASLYAPVGAKFITQTADGTLSGEQALGALATGILKNTTTTGVLSIAAAGTDYLSPTLTSAYLYVGNGSNVATGVAMSGDASISNTGSVTVSDDSHSHTTTTISGLDISSDTNLSASGGVTLTGDALSHTSGDGYNHIPSTGASTQILQYSAAGTAKWVSASGDVTIADGGAMAVADDSHAHVYSNIDATTSDNWAAQVTDETGSGGGFVRATGPTITGANLGVVAASTISGKIEHLRFTLISPNAAVTSVGSPYNIPIWTSVDSAITVTRINVTCNADPTTEIAGDLKYADTFIGLANAVVINDFDTASGVRNDNTITSASVAAGKCLYVSFDAVPESALKTISFDILYYYQ
jgi:trimeric autotransporter adhesin